MRPLVTLTTDFGTRDSYVAELKGVLLSEGPKDLRIIDLTHEIEPFDVYEAALFARAALPRFPSGTIHLVVVDPGVGSARKPIAARSQGQVLVGPDNGLFGYLFDGCEEVHVIEPERLGHRPMSSTFHGRDLFAPAAARLACGSDASELGPRIDTYQRLVFPMVEVSGDTLSGRVIHIDRYGNLVTNIPETTLRAFMGDASDPHVYVAERAVRGLIDHYAQGKVGQLVALFGSSGLLEVAACEASAANKLGADLGCPVRVTRG